MSTNVFMPTYLGDLQRDTQDLDACHLGAYTAAMWHQWVRGSLPADLDKVLQIMRLRGSNAQSIAQYVLETFFVRTTAGTWVNAAQRQLKAVQDAKSLKAKEHARLAAVARWDKARARGHIVKRPSNAQSMLNCNAQNAPKSNEINTCNAQLETESATAMLGALPEQCQSEVRQLLPPSLEQAQGPSPAGPRRSSTRSASHHAIPKRAAKRQSPHKRSRAAQTSIPLTDAPRVDPAPVAARSTGASRVHADAVFTPQDDKFAPIANEIRTNYWHAVNPDALGPCPWDGKAKAKLSRLLSGPLLGYSTESIVSMLMNRARAVGLLHGTGKGSFNPSAAPADWIDELPRFAGGPVNAFNEPIPVSRKGVML